MLSWALLSGRCRDCGARISSRYPAVELLLAILFVAAYLHFGALWLTLKVCVFCFLVTGLIFMDAETGLLPREFTYAGILLGLAFAPIAPLDTAGARFLMNLFRWRIASAYAVNVLDAFLGAAVGAGFFYLAWAFYYLLRKRHGVGFGDIALMGMAGAFLGLKLILLVIFAAPILGVIYAALTLLFESRNPRATVPDSSGELGEEDENFLSREIPFGVFLGACSLISVFFGQALWRWYLELYR